MVIDTLHSERFCDLSPYQVYAQLLDEGRYMCAIRMMYRILHDVHGDVKERRKQVNRPHLFLCAEVVDALAMRRTLRFQSPIDRLIKFTT